MSQNDNAQSLRLYESVKRNIGEEMADSMAEKIYLSKSADFKRKFKWANDVCDYLESNFEPEQIKQIRMDCSCTPPPKYINDVKKLYQKSNSLDEFCEKYNSAYEGKHSVWCENNVLFFSYPSCYCSCVKRMSENISTTWCFCTLGYTKAIFDAVFNCNTQVELIESIKTNSSRCVMSIIQK